MKIGSVEVCDHCGAAYTPHTPDCPQSGEGPPTQLVVNSISVVEEAQDGTASAAGGIVQVSEQLARHPFRADGKWRQELITMYRELRRLRPDAILAVLASDPTLASAIDQEMREVWPAGLQLPVIVDMMLPPRTFIIVDRDFYPMLPGSI